jgi:hypothetical protein
MRQEVGRNSNLPVNKRKIYVDDEKEVEDKNNLVSKKQRF